MSCFVADRLVGSSLRSIVGRKLGRLEPRIAAVLASLSTASLPVEPICPATHLNSTSRFVRLSFEVLIASSIRSSLMLRFISSMRCWADWGREYFIVSIVAWLSMLSVIF